MESSLNTPDQTSFWSRITNLIASPAAGVPAHEQRNARLISWLTFTLAVGGLLTVLLNPANAITLVATAVFVLAFVLSRTVYFRWAVYIFIIGFSALPFGYNALHTGEFTQQSVALGHMWLILPILIASAVLPLRQNIVVVVGLFVATLLMPVFIQTLTFRLIILSASFIGLSGGLVLAFMNHRNLLERDAQAVLYAANEALRESEASLERRIEERTKQLVEARALAEQANQIKSQFLASVSHELRTPLNGIINFSAFVSEGVFGPVNEKQKNALVDVSKNADHLLSLINDVLDISKIESGSLKLFIEDNINLTVELDDVIRNGETLVGKKPVQFVRNIDADLPLMRGDKRRIRQIMFNIVSNACKFTEKGTIEVSAHHDGGKIHMSVRDTGPGIAPHDYAAVFETFKQTETGLRSGGGTGLGMPISQRLAEAHGGQMWLESVVGQGSTFHVELPVRYEVTEEAF